MSYSGVTNANCLKTAVMDTWHMMTPEAVWWLFGILSS